MATKKTPPPQKKPAASPKQVPLGSGLADRAKAALVNRRASIDDQVEGKKR